MDDKVRLVLIYGSVREGRLCDSVVNWVREEIAQRSEFELTLVDPARLQRPAVDDEAAVAVRHGYLQQLARADAFLIVTPEYNHGYPAALKQLIDEVPISWEARPVAFVSYGGQSGGLRAVEQLRQVLAEMHATTVRNSVSFSNAWEQFDEQGRLAQPGHARSALARTLVQLNWWALALREGRRRSPYERVRG
ncbi:NAD(P)H-dependent oxidoreductase [Pseudomonas sp. GD03944]|uniref:NADPH-dependent FMN reductase n=1 Tax=Pseudomonas sp. GD03944 TaxID=2975409 RepID=UPI00244774EF|nr:NAD(P)H-dependent oxidoreductase [Pseudomonas sp. GD03944]MDH1265417.1 NAD(P)H-dependent oxidoreductase [Pseudomonas sp. GD03944]